MKAIVYFGYGAPDVLRYEDVEKPTPGDGEVLIKVRAASVNPADCHFIRGKPYAVRMMTGLRRPKSSKTGIDVAGEVEAAGPNVTQFKPGDAVFGACRGSFAGFATASQSRLERKPQNVSFAEAAAVPVAGVTALQAVRDYGHVQAGQKVLINGASGGVGTFAVQIAKSFGAQVTGVCSTRNVELVRSIGADRVIDYTEDDFARRGERYDVMLDCIGNHSLSACRGVLTSRGTYVAIGGQDGGWIGPFARVIGVLLLSRFVRQKLVMGFARQRKEDLIVLRELVEAGKITPVIDRRYPLEQVAQAVRYLEQGHARGKVVITVD